MSTLAPDRFRLSSPVALAGFLAACALVAILGSLAASDSGATYAALRRPAWAPPSWLFGPVWTVLYATIGVAGWLAWRRVGLSRAMVPYGVQLVLNAAWTPVFFGADAYGAALAVIIALWLAILATVAVFWRVARAAALLLLPYLGWVTYAGALNA
ncbi:MAG TPA: TspO/MBR family protein, partial [Pilimelia sp.]|nr:TspO/MBR family protein [Pilimelia sp.]